MSDKNLEQRTNIKFCVKIGKSASETLALLTVAYGEYAMKISSAFEWYRPAFLNLWSATIGQVVRNQT
jgi:hypothetical protein